MAQLAPPTLIVRRREIIVPRYRIAVVPLEERIAWALAAQHRSGFSAANHRFAARAPAPLVTTAALVDFCYGDDPAGGPLTASQSLRKVIHCLNGTLVPCGWRIVSEGHLGYRLQELPP